MVDIRYYVDVGGDAPFAEWFAELEPVASAKIARVIARMEQGNFSNAKGVGERACSNTRSILARAIACTSGETATRSSFCSR
jgi:hypothetical protein